MDNARQDKIAFWLIVFSAVLLTLMGGYFTYYTNQQSGTLARQALAATDSNRAVIDEVLRDITIHGRADADRSCAAAKGLLYLLRQSPDLEPEVQDRFQQYVDDACKFVPVGGGSRGEGGTPNPPEDPNPSQPGDGGEPPSQPPSGGNPQPNPDPPAPGPGPDPDPSPDPEPSPSLVCVEVLGERVCT